MSHQLVANNSSIILSVILVLISLYVGWKEKLGVDKEIIVAVIRAIIQLTIVGYILKYVFKINNWLLTVAIMIFIIFNAAYNAKQRSNKLPGAMWISLLAIFIGTGVSISVVILTGSIKFIPMQVVPITGMMAGKSMVAVGLCYRNMNTYFKDRKEQVMEKLSLGATPLLASKDIIRDSIKTGIQPTIDSAKTLGLVSLPGMMSGLIFAGVDPVLAIKYQIMITFMLLSNASLAAIIACYCAYKKFYNSRDQLISE